MSTSPLIPGLIAVSALFAGAATAQTMPQKGESPLYLCAKGTKAAAVYDRGEYNPRDKSAKHLVTLQDKGRAKPYFMIADGIAVVAEARRWCDGEPVVVLKPVAP